MSSQSDNFWTLAYFPQRVLPMIIIIMEPNTYDNIIENALHKWNVPNKKNDLLEEKYKV